MKKVAPYDKVENINLISGGLLPVNYHCRCKFCQQYLGLLARSDGSFYKRTDRRKYYSKSELASAENCTGHLAKTPLHVDRWALQTYSSPGDWVLDPTAGAGTTLVEASNHARHSVGIELLFGDIARANLKANNDGGLSIVVDGDVREFKSHLLKIKRKSFDLVVNNPPYFGDQSPATDKERSLSRKTSFKYPKDSRNLAFLKEGAPYQTALHLIYLECAEVLRPGGRFVVAVKDQIRQKMPDNLHEKIGNILLSCDLNYVGLALLPHFPRTLFMNTYPKRFPQVRIPLYQSILVFEKLK